MNPHRVLNEVGVNFSANRIRHFVGVLTRHLMEPNKHGYGLLVLLAEVQQYKCGKLFYQGLLSHAHCMHPIFHSDSDIMNS